MGAKPIAVNLLDPTQEPTDEQFEWLAAEVIRDVLARAAVARETQQRTLVRELVDAATTPGSIARHAAE